VSLVACALEPKVVNHTVLILQGGQGIGKSTFLLKLVPKALGNYIFSGNLNPDNKDSDVQLSECILINLDELESLTKYKEGALKEMITKSEIRVRRPYGRYHEKLPRRASLCGSVNEQAILQDPSGSRRFLIHKVKSINHQADFHIDKVYSQAYQLYKDGYQYYFDLSEIKQIHQHNESFQIQSVEEEILLASYVPAAFSDQDSMSLSASEILMKHHGDSRTKISHGEKIRMGRALQKHGFECKIVDGYKKYALKPKTYVEAQAARMKLFGS
jgi:predicted P-loop ATPase